MLNMLIDIRMTTLATTNIVSMVEWAVYSTGVTVNIIFAGLQTRREAVAQ